MPRDLLRQLLLERADATREELNGETISRVRLKQYGTNSELMPVVDVRVRGEILRDIPVAANNQELLYVAPGTPIRAQRSNTGRLEVTGLSKRAFGDIHTYAMAIPSPLPVNSGTTSGIVSSILVSVAVSGFVLRTVTLDELATISGFGTTPLEALALFGPSGNFIQLS